LAAAATARPPRLVFVPEGMGPTPHWAAPHPPLRLAFTDPALLAGPGLACAATGLPAGVVARVWGGRSGRSGGEDGGGGGGGGGSQAAFFDFAHIPYPDFMNNHSVTD
jgi:hypothetical protein